jgi:hypothetical protein
MALGPAGFTWRMGQQADPVIGGMACQAGVPWIRILRHQRSVQASRWIVIAAEARIRGPGAARRVVRKIEHVWTCRTTEAAGPMSF